ncbi:M23 family metallopeptidase [Patescibacteria group bacterium]
MNPTRYSTPLTGLDYLQWYGSHNVYHPGVDFNYGSGWDDYGQEVHAAKDGIVVYIHQKISNSNGFGKFLIIRHSGGVYSRYAHLKSIEIPEQGERVSEGTLIGYLGNSGTQSPHLHFEVFNEKMADVQRSYWRIWRYYPHGKSKQYITEHFLNPWDWLRTEQENSFFDNAKKCVMDNNISNGERPKDMATREELWQMLKNYHTSFHKPKKIKRFIDGE